MTDSFAFVSAIAGGVTAIANTVSAAADGKRVFVDPYSHNRTSSDDVEEVREQLGVSIEMLLAIMKDYERGVEQHEKKEQSETFKQWIKQVLELENQVKKESENSSSNCSKEMTKKLDKANGLWEKGNQIKNGLMVDRELGSVCTKEPPPIDKIQMFQDKLKEVLELLKIDQVRRIGITGWIGVGKTTIMLNLKNHKEVVESFEVVIWVDVSKVDGDKNRDGKDLRCRILLRLNKEITENKHTNVDRIYETLHDKKYLLLLDDVKEDLNLDDIGIPKGKEGSKVVLTTRHYAFRNLQVEKLVKVTTLTPIDALNMFQGILGDPKFFENQKKVKFAMKVLKDCHYIPLLVEQLAKFFKMKNSSFFSETEWPLRLLHDDPFVSGKAVEEYYNLLKEFFYGQMNDVQKKCFLFSALYREESDIYFDHLSECLAAIYFNGNDYKNGTSKSTLLHLVNLSLLENSKDDCVNVEKRVTMRGFIRKMALYCASKDPECKYLFNPTEVLLEFPNAESWRKKHHVSLGQNKFRQLLPIPNCSDLLTLLLQENRNLKEIPASFFDCTKEIKILDMCETGIESLPSCTLTSLKVLYLRDCSSLKQLNGEIQLPLLEVLDIRGSEIHDILTHAENSARLRRLWICFDKSGVENGTEVRLSQLSALEELVIRMKSFDQWKNRVLIKDIIKNVASLEKLRSLQFCFRDEGKVVNVIEDKPMPQELEVRVPYVEILQFFIAESCLWRKFSHGKPFQLFIGLQIPEDPHIPETLQFEKYIKYCGGEGTEPPIRGTLYEKYIKYCGGEGTEPPIPDVLANVDAFELVDHKDIVQLSDFGRVDRVLSNLQHLYLKDLPKLTNIWSEPGECGSLVNLQTLVLSGCPMLTTIFPGKIIQLFHKMECLTVENCSGAVKIFEKFENDGNGLNQLPNLKVMVLKELPNLENIWSEPEECGCLVELKTLVLSGCPMLTTFFPAKIIQQLRNMESLTVENCSGAVKIFEKFENDGNGLNQLPKLIEMELKELPILENIWSDESSKCQSLKTVKVVKCPKIGEDSVQINAPNLERF